MKWLNSYRIKLMLFVFVAAILFGGGSTNADFTFGEPVNLGPTVNTSSDDCPSYFSSDSLEMYFDSRRSGGYGNWDIWVSRRETIDDDWDAPENLGPTINSSQGEACAYISADGLELYFISYNRPGGYGNWDIWVSRRETIDDDWGEPENLGLPVNSSNLDSGPFLTADGLELYFGSQRSGGYGSDDIWVSRRATKDETWGEPENLGSVVNSSASEALPFLSPDGLLLFFSEDYYGPFRPGGFGNMDMWVTRRSSLSDPWGTPVNLGPIVNTSRLDGGPRISPDGSTLYFSSERSGGYGGVWGDIYQAQIIPIVDFNGDGYVDILDLVKLVNNWGTDNTLCDIGPMAWGDGIVDDNDLFTLIDYWGDDVNDPTLMTNYKLDEIEGDIACDGAGENDAVVFGEPVWQPNCGVVDGALEFDGNDDYISTPFVLNPGETSEFSVFVWILGGNPGETIISQADGVDWLAADSAEGCLMTDLKARGRASKNLLSQVCITDDQWHRIGLVWDGSDRILYVDDIEVARDTESGLAGSEGGLYIGAGNDLEEGTFFSGLIDDVRIYNRAITP